MLVRNIEILTKNTFIQLLKWPPGLPNLARWFSVLKSYRSILNGNIPSDLFLAAGIWPERSVCFEEKEAVAPGGFSCEACQKLQIGSIVLLPSGFSGCNEIWQNFYPVTLQLFVLKGLPFASVVPFHLSCDIHRFFKHKCLFATLKVLVYTKTIRCGTGCCFL